MYTNLTLIDSGTVRRGNYNHIEAAGNIYIEPGVHFNTMNATGNLTGIDICGGSLSLDGTLSLPSGHIQVSILSGQGRIVGPGNIQAGIIDFQGLLKTEGKIRVKHLLKFSGLMEDQKLVIARDIDLCGVLDIDVAIAKHVCIRTMHPKVVSLKDVRWMIRPSHVNRLTCRYAELHKCGCCILESYAADLKEGSFIHHAVCLSTITTDRSSASVMTLGGAKRYHVARC
ncbi:hypothetical protein KIM372_07250 [Bombiscardovia nodaiensis]|uniref:Uncharacterized protein n=1 Tax=Bombiscardovia nodaiensis TaxID=2932181 RepID=A0ABM8B7G7_9BIFI|nr:hypothetical protein KIM372_07250 [Bombiscardovia nodaiensis]